jgi:peptidoglycan/xylan/chitin deacetylase (PgdA/CDA1 family)
MKQAHDVEIAWPADAQAAVTFSFDDGYAATCDATVTCLQARGLCATYNIITNCVGSVFDGLPTATWSQWQRANRAGHEIASHSASHAALAGPLSDVRRLLQDFCAAPDRLAYAGQLTTTARALIKQRLRASPRSVGRSSSSTTADLAASRLSIESRVQGLRVESFAYPAGRHDLASRHMVAEAGFKSARTSDWGVNTSACDLFALRAIGQRPGLGIDELAVWLERARTSHAWLIIAFHLVAECNPTGYPYFCSLADLQRLLDAMQSRLFWVATQREVVRHLESQDL